MGRPGEWTGPVPVPAFSARQDRSDFDLEKIPHDGPVHIAFEGGQPIEIELLRPDPAEIPEFLRRLVHIHRWRGALQLTEKIRLLLAMAAMLAELFPPDILWIEVTITRALAEHLVMPWFQADLLAHLAEQRLFRRFAQVHSTLRKLPGTGDARPLADQQTPDCIHHHGGNVWTVANHGNKVPCPAPVDNP